MQRVKEPKRRQFAWQLCRYWGLGVASNALPYVTSLVVKHSRDGQPHLKRKLEMDLNISVSKDRDNTLETIIALVGAEVSSYPNRSNGPVLLYSVISWNDELCFREIYHGHRTMAMYAFCRANRLLDKIDSELEAFMTTVHILPSGGPA